jgi:TRAP-type C4-dicarboxylate transport system permease small subunit
MALMVLDVTWQIFTRFILQDSSSYTEELARFLLIWIGVLGASYAVRTKVHLGIDVLTQRMAENKKRKAEITVNVFIFLFALIIMVVGGIHLVQITFSLNQISAAMGIKMGYIYLVLPISGILIMYYSLFFIYQLVAENRGKTETGV